MQFAPNTSKAKQEGAKTRHKEPLQVLAGKITNPRFAEHLIEKNNNYLIIKKNMEIIKNMLKGKTLDIIEQFYIFRTPNYI